MPVNRNALIRYKTIDLCLQNKYRTWTLDDLIESVSDVLYDYEGIEKGVSRRTIQLDIQMMRSDKLGYNAPIIVVDKKYYAYEDPDYSIMNIPLSENDLDKLMETVDFLKQFKGFSHFRELDGMVQKLEDHIFSRKENRKPAIDFEKNENLKGLEYLDILYQSIIQRKAIKLTYQSFNARQASTFNFHPYLLKEYRNRWFLIGSKKDNDPILTLALDRIINVKSLDIDFLPRENFNAENYFKDVIGVTVNQAFVPEKVILFVTRKHAPYVLTKPFHSSQKLIERDSYGITISLDVQHNFELEKEILGMGDGVMVISPERLKRSIMNRIGNSLDLYNTTVSEKGIVSLQRKLIHKGYCVINFLYPVRTILNLGHEIFKKKALLTENDIGEITNFDQIINLKEYLINNNIERITKQISETSELKTIKYYESVPDELFNWNQSKSDESFCAFVFMDDSKIKSFTLQVIPGSHHKEMQMQELELIASNCLPVDCEVNAGGAIFTKALLILRFSESLKEKKVRFFILYFSI